MFDLPKYGDGVCLARMAELLDRLAIDRARLRRNSVVVTGSNGKGSTAAFCATIARAYGLRTGLFTSPHLFRFNERFQVDGAPIGDHDLTRLVARIEAAIADVAARLGERFGAFEAMFALACLYFQESDCEFAVFEAGIGGRYDPVRLVASTVTCVTSVDYEHVELLGHSLQLIVSDKSDACAAGGAIIYGENCRGLRRHIVEYNRSREVASLFVRDEIRIGGEVISASAQRFDFGFADYDFRSLDTALLGLFQFNNATIAIALLLRWLEQTRPVESFAANRNRREIGPARRALARPSRSHRSKPADRHRRRSHARRHQAIARKPQGGLWHARVDSRGRRILRQEGQRDRGALAPSFDTIICTTAHHKGGDAAAIAATVRKINPQADVRIAATIEDAFSASQALAASLGRKIYVAGGLFTAIEFAAVARGLRASELDFF